MHHFATDFPLALTYDDVLLMPAYSEILPHQAATATSLTPSLRLPLPILSAAMDTVTEGRLATAMAQSGGLGVLHKNMTIDAQCAAAVQVKSAAVVDASLAAVDGGGALRVAAAVGVGPAGLSRAQALVAAGVDMLVVDTAHGHSKGVLDTVATLRRLYAALPLAAGNVATPDGAVALARAGANVVKVGIGPGSICTTRSVAGVGVPQLSAVLACAAALADTNATVIADGGLKCSGDLAKAIAAGALAVMLGSVLAACEEAPGETFVHQGKTFRRYRGMGSLDAMEAGSADRYFQGPTTGSTRKLVAEGVAAAVPVGLPISDTLAQWSGGLRAAMGYLGASSLAELQHRAQFVRQTPAGLKESLVHGVALF